MMKAPTEKQREDRSRTFVASTDTIDADGDIVEQDFVLDRFKANPVVLFAHKSRELPIGRAKNIGVVDGQFQLDVVFASEKANPLAENVYQSVQEETLKGLSIGFIPREVRQETRDGKDVFVFSKNEIFEASVTPVPSNPEALAKYRAKAHPAPSGLDQTATGGEENEMNVKDFEEKLAKLQGELDSTKKDLDGAVKELGETKAKLATLTERNAALEEVYSKEKERAAKLYADSVDKELEELIGVKIAPTEKEALVKLAMQDEDLFREQLKGIAARPNMKHVEGSGLPVDDPKDNPPPTVEDGVSGKQFEELVTRNLG